MPQHLHRDRVAPHLHASPSPCDPGAGARSSSTSGSHEALLFAHQPDLLRQRGLGRPLHRRGHRHRQRARDARGGGRAGARAGGSGAPGRAASRDPGRELPAPGPPGGRPPAVQGRGRPRPSPTGAPGQDYRTDGIGAHRRVHRSGRSRRAATPPPARAPSRRDPGGASKKETTAFWPSARGILEVDCAHLTAAGSRDPARSAQLRVRERLAQRLEGPDRKRSLALDGCVQAAIVPARDFPRLERLLGSTGIVAAASWRRGVLAQPSPTRPTRGAAPGEPASAALILRLRTKRPC